MRKKVYPQWVEAGRMPAQVADRELAAMMAIVETLLSPTPQGPHKLAIVLSQETKQLVGGEFIITLRLASARPVKALRFGPRGHL